MKIRKLVAVAAIVGLASSTASIAPASAHGGYWGSPWPVVAVVVGVAGVMTNAAYVWHTQCRELSSQEAMTSTFLPFVGMAFNAHANKCR